MNYRRKLQAGLVKPFRSRNYLDWVKQQTCPCGAPADDPSHVNHYKGLGTKATDLFVWPSCRACHQLYESNRDSWHEQFGSEWEWVCLTIAQAVDEGIIEI